MASSTTAIRKVPPYLLVTAVVLIAALAAALVYLNKPAHTTAEPTASREATGYLKNLQLSDVNMKATENFMKQQVVEVEGKITNNGPKTIDRIDVYCIFDDVSGQHIHRERVPVVRRTTAGSALGPGQTRAFRLPFDSLPDGWNQAMPHLVIAQIVFAQ